jgi:HEAT repeat protein
MRSSIVLILLLVPTASATDPPANDAKLIDALIEALDDPDGEVRLNVATALANIGETAVPNLIDALAFEKKERRIGAALALGRIGPPARAAIPKLLHTLKDADDVVRRESSYALSRIVIREAAPVTPVEPWPHLPPLDPPPSGGPR